MEKIYRLEFSPISSIGPFKKSVFRIYVFHILRKKSFAKYLTWILLWLTYLFRISWLVRLWCTFKRPTRCLNPYFIHIFCLWPSHNFFFMRVFVFLSVRTNAVYFAFSLDAFPWQSFGREEYRFSLPPAQSFSTRKNRSYLFDFQCLMRYIVLWKYSFITPICSL